MEGLVFSLSLGRPAGTRQNSLSRGSNSAARTGTSFAVLKLPVDSATLDADSQRRERGRFQT